MVKKFATIVRPTIYQLCQKTHFHQIKLKIAGNIISNIHIFPDVFSTLLSLQQGTISSPALDGKPFFPSPGVSRKAEKDQI